MDYCRLIIGFASYEKKPIINPNTHIFKGTEEHQIIQFIDIYVNIGLGLTKNRF